MTFRPAFLPAPAFLLAAPSAWGTEAETVTIGVLAYRGPDEVVSSWGRLPERLNAAISGHRFGLRPLEGPAPLSDAVRQREVDFVLTNSTQYVSLAAEVGIRRITTVMLPEAVSPDQALGSTVITRADRKDLTELGHLRGKHIAAVAEDAFGGYLAAARELQQAGADLVAGGLPSKTISVRLDISDRTVQVHRLHLMAKLEVHSVAEFAKLIFLGEGKP